MSDSWFCPSQDKWIPSSLSLNDCHSNQVSGIHETAEILREPIPPPTCLSQSFPDICQRSAKTLRACYSRLSNFPPKSVDHLQFKIDINLKLDLGLQLANHSASDRDLPLWDKAWPPGCQFVAATEPLPWQFDVEMH